MDVSYDRHYIVSLFMGKGSINNYERRSIVAPVVMIHYSLSFEPRTLTILWMYIFFMLSRAGLRY